MNLVGCRHHVFVNQRLGVVLGAHPALLHHHLNFLGKLLGRQHQIVHPVCLQLQSQSQLGFLQLLKIGGMVAAGKGVFLAAGNRDPLGKFTGGYRTGSLEHHVFQHVSHAGRAVKLIHAACAIPYLRHHHRRAVVFLDDNLHAVGKLVFMDIRHGLERQHRRQQPE